MAQPDLEYYYEELQFRRIRGGHVILLPSDMDVALQRINLETYETSIARMDEEQPPPEVVAAYESVKTLDIPETRDSRALERSLKIVADWEDERIRNRRVLQSAIWAARRAVERHNQLTAKMAENGLPGQSFSEFYRMREFSHGERVLADERFAPLNPDTNTRDLDQNARVDWLLGMVLQGKVRLTDEREIEQARDPHRGYGFLDEKLERYERDEEGRMDPATLQDRRAEVLGGRMWAANQMDPLFASFL